MEKNFLRQQQAMDQYYAVLNDGRPSSVLECENEDGEVDEDLHEEYLAKLQDIEAAERNYFLSIGTPSGSGSAGGRASSSSSSAALGGRSASASKRQKKSCKSLRPYYFANDGTIKYLKPTETVWYYAYVREENRLAEDSKLMMKFRRRFRMPHPAYLDLLEKMKTSGDWFGRWQRKDAVGDDPSPLGLMLLGALRYLGRGLTFDDLEEYTAISEETHRQFFHRFIEYGEKVLYPEYVIMPQTAAEYETHQREFTTGGLWGAGFSCDATNVIMWRCQHNLKQSQMGFKNTHPARTYNVSVNHRRQILYSTKGHPSRWNDKTLALFDDFLSGIHDGKFLQDVRFELLKYGGNAGNLEEVVNVKYRGAWGLVDNGYHRWACTQAPAKVNHLLTEQRLSEWIESFRKDIECFFGILKGRWRILKTGIRLEGTVAADRTWLTCCALHNLLLTIDGLHEEWREGVPSDWEGELGRNDAEECQRHLPTFAIQRLNNTELEEFGSRAHEAEAAADSHLNNNHEEAREDIGVLNDVTKVRTDDEGAIFVNSLSYQDFRDRLVTHFDILFQQRRIKWPTRAVPREARNTAR